MRVEVTRFDLDFGQCNEPKKCAVALAIARAFGTADVYVDGSTAFVGLVQYQLPRVVREFIDLFDEQIHPPSHPPKWWSDLRLYPFSFELTEEDDMERRG